jgi:hypothetical protein
VYPLLVNVHLVFQHEEHPFAYLLCEALLDVLLAFVALPSATHVEEYYLAESAVRYVRLDLRAQRHIAVDTQDVVLALVAADTDAGTVAYSALVVDNTAAAVGQDKDTA